mmetsp:Transcript_20114/g.50054  ORF Transcript_20114/g.50054 Transcript_20114/m.50054 type:complete len:82 (+) Transcript_20114:847-1092(+)
MGGAVALVPTSIAGHAMDLDSITEARLDGFGQGCVSVWKRKSKGAHGADFIGNPLDERVDGLERHKVDALGGGNPVVFLNG